MNLISSVPIYLVVIRKILVIVICLAASPSLFGQVLQFTRPTDTVRFGPTVVRGPLTFEARFMLDASAPLVGTGPNHSFIFDAWSNGLEDKYLFVAPDLIEGKAYPLDGNTSLSAAITVSRMIWHHIAYVYDGAQDWRSRLQNDYMPAFVAVLPISVRCEDQYRDHTAAASCREHERKYGLTS